MTKKIFQGLVMVPTGDMDFYVNIRTPPFFSTKLLLNSNLRREKFLNKNTGVAGDLVPGLEGVQKIFFRDFSKNLDSKRSRHADYAGNKIFAFRCIFSAMAPP